ncbi:hypothetical protein J6590_041260, partial [Homalodisca vitripennis]
MGAFIQQQMSKHTSSRELCRQSDIEWNQMFPSALSKSLEHQRQFVKRFSASQSILSDSPSARWGLRPQAPKVNACKFGDKRNSVT